MVDFACIFFFWDVTRRLIIRLGFLLDLFIFPAIFFICKFGFIIKEKCKRGAALSEWADFW